jgi:thiol-disulfide isomerase/thioredoxin
MRNANRPYRERLCAVIAAGVLCLATACAPSSVVDTTGGRVSKAEGGIKELKDFDVQMLDAPAVKLSKLAGDNKVLLVNFWATWCGPCVGEIPYLAAAQKEYRDKGVELIGLSVEDPREASEEVRAFARKNGINYQLGFASPELFNAFNDDPRGAIPQTFIFSKDGKLVKHIKGSNPSLMKEMLEEGIEEALKA